MRPLPRYTKSTSYRSHSCTRLTLFPTPASLRRNPATGLLTLYPRNVPHKQLPAHHPGPSINTIIQRRSINMRGSFDPQGRDTTAMPQRAGIEAGNTNHTARTAFTTARKEYTVGGGDMKEGGREGRVWISDSWCARSGRRQADDAFRPLSAVQGSSDGIKGSELGMASRQQLRRRHRRRCPGCPLPSCDPSTATSVKARKPGPWEYLGISRPSSFYFRLFCFAMEITGPYPDRHMSGDNEYRENRAPPPPFQTALK